MNYEILPDNFNPKFEIVSCFIEHNGKVIILKRHNHKSQGGRWGLPAGKVEEGGDITRAIIREVKKKTNIHISFECIDYFKKTYHRHGDYDFAFHTFFIKLDFLPEVIISPNEHQEFTWKTPLEIIAMRKDEIVEDLDYICKLFYKII